MHDDNSMDFKSGGKETEEKAKQKRSIIFNWAGSLLKPE